MWKEITSKEYFQMLEQDFDKQELIQHDVTEWLDFVELEWRTNSGKLVLRKTEQENYDECESYPPTLRYYKHIDSSVDHSLLSENNQIENLTWGK